MKMSSDFYSAEIDATEMSDIVKGFVIDAFPDDKIEHIGISDDGNIEVELESGMEIEIEVDWGEFVLK